jgi:50S ribosomal protein L16 3-hydroxylase
LRLLADFEAEGDWVLEPGDILYIPPGFAHDGVAVGTDCMTYSIGFRAPSRAELIEGWAIHCAQALGDDDRYADPDLGTPANPLQANPGQITPAALDRLHAMMRAALDDRAAFARWFGSFTSLPKYADTDPAATDWRPDMPADPLGVREALALGVPSCAIRPAASCSSNRKARHGKGHGKGRGTGHRAVRRRTGIPLRRTARPLARSLCAASTFTLDPRWRRRRAPSPCSSR